MLMEPSAVLSAALTPDEVRNLEAYWRGTTPPLNFIYVHSNRVVRKYDLNMIYAAGPGHGGPGMDANTYLEGTYGELF